MRTPVIAGAPAPSAGAAVTLPVRPDSGEVVMRSFAGTLPAEALCTDRIHAAAQRRRSVLHRHPRPRQRAECGKRQIIYAARPETIRRYGGASATTGSRYSIFLPATGPTAYSPYATNPTPSAIARWNRYGKRLHLIASTHGDKKQPAGLMPAGCRIYPSVTNDLRRSSFRNIKKTSSPNSVADEQPVMRTLT